MDTEKWSNLSKDTELLNSGASIQIQITWTWHISYPSEFFQSDWENKS